ncbi:hypothetical protein [Nocardioides caricicola]|uniref:Uncharacterized protein n=1 Tax=Nocardioides caricicola TaxID=634770 RepID=A0ABW0N208_9ACTN
MNPSSENKTGVESYDHGDRLLPEYFKVREALNELVWAINRNEVGPAADTYEDGQRHWLKLVEQMAASLPYADGCEKCGRTCWPVKTKVSDGGLDGTYACPSCRVQWTCYYAVNLADFE